MEPATLVAMNYVGAGEGTAGTPHPPGSETPDKVVAASGGEEC